MPNIEVHGLVKTKKLLNKIAGIVRENFPDEVSDTVVTFTGSKVFDLNGKKRPYLRVIHVSNKKAEEMAKVFSRFFEAEALAIGNFFEIKELP
jgi:hypothetical protein